MSQTTMKRLYLLQVGSVPAYQIPIVCYLVQTSDGEHILIDSGLPESIPEGESSGIVGFANGRDVIQQLASIGVQPDEIATVISTHYDGDHAGRHAAFTQAHYVVQRVHHEDAASNPRYAAIRSQWDQPMERMQLLDGDTELLPGLELIETSGHVPGHQSVLVRLPQTGPVLLAIDAISHALGDETPETRSAAPYDMDPAGLRASTRKLMDLAAREGVKLIVYGHDAQEWAKLKKAPDFYS